MIHHTYVSVLKTSLHVIVSAHCPIDDAAICLLPLRHFLYRFFHPYSILYIFEYFSCIFFSSVQLLKKLPESMKMKLSSSLMEVNINNAIALSDHTVIFGSSRKNER